MRIDSDVVEPCSAGSRSAEVCTAAACNSSTRGNADVAIARCRAASSRSQSLSLTSISTELRSRYFSGR